MHILKGIEAYQAISLTFSCAETYGNDLNFSFVCNSFGAREVRRRSMSERGLNLKFVRM